MRKIKFRAWDKELKSMRYSPCPDLLLTMDGELYSEHEDGEQRNVSDIHILMQHTGLKDKNGKEIYEGDIIKRPSSYSLEVYWMGLAWGVRWKDNGNEEESIICDDGGDLSLQENALIFTEIIGNIYENPDLLK